MSKTSVLVRAQVTVEIDLGVWNYDESMKNLREIANRDAVTIIQNRLNKDGVKVIGEPKLVTVQTAEL